MEAERLAKQLVESRFAGCVNIINNISSYDINDGMLNNANEIIMLIKTTENHLEDIKSLMIDAHPYSVPCLFVIDVKSHNDEYNKWLFNAIKTPI